MKRPKFISVLAKRERSLGKLRKKDVMIFNVMGNYGNYQIRVGATDPKHHSRPIEISGRIHHLFVNRDHVEALPTKEEVDKNLRGTVIMSNVVIHLFDEKGDGYKVLLERVQVDGAHAEKLINLAGEDGEKMMSEYEATGKLADETYHIVQEDILKSL